MNLIDVANERRRHSNELNLNNNIDQAKIKVERQLMLRALNVKKKHNVWKNLLTEQRKPADCTHAHAHTK